MKNVNLSMNTNPSSYKQTNVDEWNNNEGELTEYNCSDCKNKGYIMFLNEDNIETLRKCSCQNIRSSLKNIKQSGLENLLEDYSFEKFNTEESWQKKIKDAAKRFMSDTYGNWYFIGGQVGSGKSHICTAIVKELLYKGNEALYMKWRDDSVGLKKAITSDNNDYSPAISRFKNVKVLYIDDFLKTEKGKQPSAADIMLAFEILNHRYINKDLITIISTERSVDELIEIDEAIGSRIYQRSKNYCIELAPDKTKNMRMKGLFK